MERYNRSAGGRKGEGRNSLSQGPYRLAAMDSPLQIRPKLGGCPVNTPQGLWSCWSEKENERKKERNLLEQWE